MDKYIRPKNRVKGEITVLGDKSISHRSIMLGSIAKGTTEIKGFLTGQDCLSTISCFAQMGVKIELSGEVVKVCGLGLRGLMCPKDPLDAGNSGTTIRLMSGILAAQGFESVITGDTSIQTRPMDRIINPLREMGADIKGMMNPTKAPLIIKGKQLNPITYMLPVASAQVKSAVALAALYASGPAKIIEPSLTRDHTEIMINFFGGNVTREGKEITVHPVEELSAACVEVPGDISSASYFITAAIISENSEIIVKNVGINPTRTGIITALKEMGAKITYENERLISGEPVADICAKSSDLKAITLEGSIIPLMIDEIPIFAVAALFAHGTTIIKDASELRVKESDRIESMVTELTKMGASIEATKDGMIIQGGTSLKGAVVSSRGDHRVAMSLAVAALAAQGESRIENSNCVDISFPGFYETLEKLY